MKRKPIIVFKTYTKNETLKKVGDQLRESVFFANLSLKAWRKRMFA